MYGDIHTFMNANIFVFQGAVGDPIDPDKCYADILLLLPANNEVGVPTSTGKAFLYNY